MHIHPCIALKMARNLHCLTARLETLPEIGKHKQYAGESEMAPMPGIPEEEGLEGASPKARQSKSLLALANKIKRLNVFRNRSPGKQSPKPKNRASPGQEQTGNAASPGHPSASAGNVPSTAASPSRPLAFGDSSGNLARSIDKALTPAEGVVDDANADNPHLSHLEDRTTSYLSYFSEERRDQRMKHLQKKIAEHRYSTLTRSNKKVPLV
jgi:hypothetical protein